MLVLELGLGETGAAQRVRTQQKQPHVAEGQRSRMHQQMRDAGLVREQEGGQDRRWTGGCVEDGEDATIVEHIRQWQPQKGRQ